MARDLKSEVDALKAQVQRLVQTHQALGLPTSPWVSPQQAAQLLAPVANGLTAKYPRLNTLE